MMKSTPLVPEAEVRPTAFSTKTNHLFLFMLLCCYYTRILYGINVANVLIVLYPVK